MHRRSLIISTLLVVLMSISAGVVHASGGNGQRAAATKSSSAENAKKPSDATGRGKTIELFGQQEPDEASTITADGRVFTSPEPLPEDYVFSPGDVQVYRERLFKLDDSDPDNPAPRGDQIGAVLVECTTVTAGEAPEDISVICSRVFTLDGRGDIAAAESFTFADPLADTISITGGTGKFRDAGGEISFDAQEIEGTDLFNSIYTIHLLALDDGHRRAR